MKILHLEDNTADASLQKPFAADALLAAVHNLLPSPPPAGSSP